MMLTVGCRVRTHTRPYAVDFDYVGKDAGVDVDGVGNAEINLEVDDVDGYVDVGLQGMGVPVVTKP